MADGDTRLLVFDRDLMQERKYWVDRLSGQLPAARLPRDRWRPLGDARTRNSIPLDVDDAVAGKMAKLTGNSPFLCYATLMAALKVCLHRYSGHWRIAVGSPARRKNADSIESTNALVILDEIRGRMTFREFLLNVRETLQEAYARQRYPYERVLRDLGRRNPGETSPLFGVSLELEGLHHPMHAVGQEVAIVVRQEGPCFAGRIEYSAELFTQRAIERFASHYGNVLMSALNDTSARLRDLPVLDETERRELLVGLNEAPAPAHDGSTILEMVESQADRSPEAVAVLCGDRRMTYAHLNEEANRIARHLRGLALRPGTVVGVHTGRCPEMVAALLGVFKAGAVYLPLAPDLPVDRLRFMLEDTHAPVVLSEPRLVDQLPEFEGQVVPIQIDWGAAPSPPGAEAGQAPTGHVGPDDPAYVIYTSGSTGRPKGCLISHDAIARHCFYVQRHYELTPSDRVLQFAVPSFDASLEQILTTLVSGATLVLWDADVWPADEFHQRITRLGLTVVNLPPAYFRQWAESMLPDASGLPNGRGASQSPVRLVIVGGDVLTPDMVRSWLEGPLRGARLLNAYGPTEATITTTTFGVPPYEGDVPANVPIGRPVADKRVYVLDQYLEPVPMGAPGELYIGGPAIARSYLNRPELTAERFVPNPFAPADGNDAPPGSRLYRTGDLARCVPGDDGSGRGYLEFLGRVDLQVKIRGYRIELGEVEAALARHPVIQQVVVVAREDDGPVLEAEQGEESRPKRLVAYMTTNGAPAPEIGELRGFLGGQLPEYMIPAAFVFLDALPMMPTGKIDRKALPAPDHSRRGLGTRYVPPRTPTEQWLAEIWSEVLAVEQIGVLDDFFELGGHSLLATQVASRVRSRLKVDLPLRQLFEDATIANLAATIDRQGPLTGSPAQGGPPIQRVSREGDLPLSFAQERLWLLSQLEPDSPFYNVPAAVRVQGRLDVAALQRSLNEIVSRHEVLRTTFHAVDGRPVQRIAPHLEVAVPLVDLSGLGENERERDVRRRAADEAQKPFDLSSGPLLRAQLLRLADEEHVFLLTEHHIVWDGWSLGVFLRELGALYEANLEDRPSSLPGFDLQYADFAVWQRDWLSGDTLDRSLAYWRKQLDGAPTTLELPTDRPRPPMQTYRGRRHAFALSPELSDSLTELSRREGVTLFMTLLAAFQTLLGRYSRQAELCVGTPVAGRDREEIEGLIGFFVNTLVMRADLSGNPTFLETLARTREVALGAYAHQELPFEQLVDHLQTERDLSRAPLFQVMFALQNAPLPEVNLAGLSFSPVESDDCAVLFDMTLSMTEMAGSLQGWLEYNTDLFDAATIEGMASAFGVLLEAVAADPSRRVAELPLMTEAERERIVSEWNATEASWPEDTCLHEFIEGQAARTPEAVAVVAAKQQLTYYELNQRANQLAHYLRGLGVGPDALVGICLERSLEIVVGVLGVLKAGGAYVPLDPAYPKKRLRFMLEDCRAPVLLTTGRQWFPGYRGRVVSLDADRDTFAGEDVEDPVNQTTPDHTAYVIYTSGSTGRPKGVLISHRAICNHMHWILQKYPLNAGDKVIQRTPFSFDASVWEFYAPLLSGARLVMAPAEAHRDVALLTHTIASESVTTLQLVPSLLHVLLEEPGFRTCRRLRRVFCGGERLPVEVQQRFFEWAKQTCSDRPASLHNLYGPTEATIDATSWDCGVEPCHRGVPIGRPISNTQAYVLDPRLEPVPAGVPGELYLGGAGLARGYLRRPALTAERFVPNPFGPPGSRLYKTGDLVRYRSGEEEGVLEFLGRMDHQVKLRGYRIELGEIESQLAACEGVRQAVVLARNGRLVAYVTSEDSRSVDEEELRRSLHTRLPEYMIPAVFFLLDGLPLTPNGKVNRRALPDPAGAASERREEYVAPRTSTERLLAEIWSEVLGIERIGVHDNFFGLGGHSLQATQVVSRIRERLSVELPLRQLFGEPTIENLARSIDQTLTEGGPAFTDALAPPFQPVSRDTDLPLSFAQERLWFLDQLEPGSPLYNIPAAVRLTGALNVEAIRASLSDLVARHECLRTVFPSVAGRPVQKILPEHEPDLSIVDLTEALSGERESEARRLAEEEALRAFDLARGPLLRTSLVRLSPDEHVFLMTQHHIISDGWSLGVFIRELAELYEAHCAGRTAALPRLDVQYADFAVWQRERLTGNALERQLSYWKSHLANAPHALTLPTDRARPAMQSYRGAALSFTLPKDLTESLKSLARDHDATLFMTLLGALDVFLSRYSGQEQVCVGTPVAGRNRREIEGLIGLFVNTLVLRGDLTGNPTFAELLRRTREATLGGFAHQDLPFEHLVEHVGLDRDLSRHPLFQVMFAMQNVPLPRLNVPGLTFSPVETGRRTAMFDLTLSAVELEDGLRGEWEYNTDLFDASTVERMAQHFRILLKGIVACPDAPVSDLPLLSEQERRRVLVDWNATAQAGPVVACVHHLFEMQASQTPDAEAVLFEGARLTYGELDARANRLARLLRGLGVRPGAPVASCIERSLDAVVALLAVFKAGGVYAPLYPLERLRFMLDDVQATVLVTHRHLENALPDTSAETVYLDADWESTVRDRPAKPAPPARQSDPAYVVYTSGTTGRPKGVLVSHGALARHCHHMRHRFDLSPTDRVLQFASPMFDVALEQMLCPLLAGATLVLRDPELWPPDEFHRRVADLGLTAVDLPPAYFHQWARALAAKPPNESAAEPDTCSPLRLVIVGGDVLPADAVRLWQDGPGRSVPLLNAYGPTEATITSTLFDVPLYEDGCLPQRIPVGRPVANTHAYILDGRLSPVPLGVFGELHLGGDGLAVGYVNRPDLTGERFIPNPFGGAGSRLYKTGDFARYLPDGNIEFLGRRDHQVKIRGFRIELSEIETALAQHPAVRQTTVVAVVGGTREESRRETRLVAYVTPDGDSPVTADALRRFLTEKLPDHAVPSAFVFLDAFPTTPGGDVDRSALPAPDASRPDAGVEYAAPKTPTEQWLADIWAEVLGIERLGVDDNFFDLGGHSLLATQVISRVRDRLGFELPLRLLFEEPTVANLAAAIDRLHAEGAAQPAPPLEPVPREGNIPLSFGQERLWFLDRMEPGNPFYNIPGAVRVSGRLDVDALRRSLNAIVERHEVLRTTFATVDGRPVQVIAPHLALELPVTDLSDLRQLCAEAQEAEIRRLIVKEATRPFDLATGPLLRARLLRLGATEHVFLLVEHHIVSDAWSVGVVVAELAALYQAFSVGRPSPLPSLPVQYADYAAWQRAVLSRDIGERQAAYWKSQLAGAPKALELPTDRPRPAVQRYRGGQYGFALSPGLTHGLRDVSRQEGTTLFMTLLAAFQTLLYRYSGQDQVCVGTPVAGRNHSQIEGLVGFFVNTLVLRGDLSGNPSFKELLVRTRETTLGAYAHQDLPFEQLVDRLQPERDMSRSPLFQVMFTLQNAPLPEVKLPGLTFAAMEIATGAAKFDLTLSMVETDDDLRAGVEYNCDLFHASTVARMMTHFEVLLAALVEDPDRRIGELPLLDKGERTRMLVEWNDTSVELAGAECVHQWFEEQVERTPDGIALVLGDERLTYRELNERANRLAHYLRGQGVGPDVLVGLCVERSCAMVVGLLGVLKAGGAYVPLDPAYPKKRLQFMLDDCRAPVLLTKGKRWIPGYRGELVSLEADWEETISRHGIENPDVVARAGNLAYVIYTSGSTGEPKGTMVPHRGLVNYLRWAVSAYDAGSGCGSPVHSPLGFDLTITGLFPPLLTGGQVALIPEEESVELLAAALRSGPEFSLVKLTPVHLDVLSQLARDSDAPVRTNAFIVGGEALRKEGLSYWQAHAPGTRIINEYGPTETVVGCCVYEVPPGIALPSSIPIGRPIANTQLYVLDVRLQPVPVGVAGELYIGGDGVARGYLRRPGLTAEKFVPNPFGAPGSRLYKTGDLARFLPNGNLDFLGRRDDQVKVRGFRVELGEIESVLIQHPSIDQTAVVACEDPARPGHRRLVAYYVARGDEATSLDELRGFLSAKLPEHMIPAAFVPLEAIPLTPNGKVDRRALPSPGADRPQLARGFVPPGTTAERVLADIWGQVLRIDRVGIHDNFFHLGGDSILGIQVISRASQAGLHLSPRQLFQHQTVAELAAVAGMARAVRAEQELVTGEVPLSPIQRWFFERELPEPHHYNQAVLLEIDRALDANLLPGALDHLLRHHDALRLRFHRERPGAWRQICSEPDGVTSFRYIDLSGLAESEQRGAIEEAAADAQAGLNLWDGPMLRVVYITLAPDAPGRLLIVAHHLVMDGVSWRILLEDLVTAYQQLEDRRDVQLPPKTTSFRHWTRRLEEHANLDALAGELPYWLDALPASVAAIPVDHPDGANTEGFSETVTVALGAGETRALLQDVHAAYRTQMSDVLLAALGQAFAHWTGSASLVVDVEGHGREPLFDDVDLSRTVGWFTSIFPFFLDLADCTEPGDVLVSVKERIRRVPNRGIGYGILRYLRGDSETVRELRDRPRAEVSFNYLGQLGQAIQPFYGVRLAEEAMGPQQNPDGMRSHLLEIGGAVGAEREGLPEQFHLTIAFSRAIHERATIERLADDYLQALRSLIAHCLEPDAGRLTPSDFPDAEVSEADLNAILEQLDHP